MTTADSRLEALIAAMEQVILESDDAEIIKAAARDEAKQVRAVFSAAAEKVSPRISGRDHAQLRRDMQKLQELARSQPRLKPRLAAVFGSKKEPSADVVSKLVRELLGKRARHKPKKR